MKESYLDKITGILTDKVNGNYLSRRGFLRSLAGGSLVGGLTIPLLSDSLSMADDYKSVGNQEGYTETKLGMETVNTKFFLEGELKALPSGLKKGEFYKRIESFGKKTDTVLLIEKVSRKRVIDKLEHSLKDSRKNAKDSLKDSKKDKKDKKDGVKDAKDFYTKEDVETLLNFVGNLDLSENYIRGTRFVIETGNNNNNPSYAIYNSDGSKIAYKEITDRNVASSLRKFMNFQDHWFDVYKELSRR